MISDKMKTRLTKAATSAGVGKALPLLLAEVKECVYIVKPTKGDTSDVAPGSSRIGGYPDLPVDLPWPEGINEKGQSSGPTTFLIQINLSDLPRIDGLPLGQEGHIWLFRPNGNSTTEAVIAVYLPGPEKLIRRQPPASKNTTQVCDAMPSAPVRFKSGISLPFSRASFAATLHEASGGRADWSMLGLEPKNCLGWVGGYAHPIEFDLYRAIAFQRLGKPQAFFADHYKSTVDLDKEIDKIPWFIKDPKKEKTKLAHWRANLEKRRPHVKWINAHRAELDAEAAQWCLLVSFNRNSGLELGDAMSLDIFIRSSDLAELKFNNLIGRWPMVL